MFGKNKTAKDPLEMYRNQVEDLLLEGEEIEGIYPLILDFFCITNKRLIFVDKDLSLTKPKTKLYSIPFNKIEGVALEKNERLLAFTDEIEIITKGKKYEIKVGPGTDARKLFKELTIKTME